MNKASDEHRPSPDVRLRQARNIRAERPWAPVRLSGSAEAAPPTEESAA